MDNLLVGNRELSQEMSNHLGLDLDRDKFFARMQVQCQPQHLWYDDHIPRVSLDGLRLSSTITVFSSGLANMLQQGPLVIGQAFEQRPSLTRGKEFDELAH